MTVLVTGGAGYIGSHMVLRLVDEGVETVVVDNLTEGHDWAVDHRATLVEGDVGDEAFMRGVLSEHGVTAIIHFAGSIRVADSVHDPLGFFANNTCATRSLIAAAVACDVPHFIFSSTAAVYGTAGAGAIAESAQLNPESPYGHSKLMSETMLRCAAQAHGLRYACLRYFNVAGADGQGRSGQSSRIASHLIKIGVQAALGLRERLEIFGTDYPTEDGTCIRDYIHVTDLIEAHWQALQYLRAGGDNLIANCGYGRGFSVRQIVDTVCRHAPGEIEVVESPRRGGDPASIVADASVAREVLQWQPRHDDIDHIVQSALEWERKLVRRNAD